MSYKALYRSYRPIHFDNLIGQEHIVQTLKNAVKENKVSHAYLFCGPRGTGKTTIAKILAKAVNCEATNNQPCEQCSNCTSFNNSNHPDIIEIDAASNNGVDEVRDLIEKVKYAPIKGTKKIYIIDEVHMMSSSAFNALLKTLEEPPAHIIFILATTEPQKVLPTIISRCQRFDFKKASVDNNKKLLEYVLKTEKIEYEEPAIALISQLADGGMRDALSILEQCLSYIQGILTLDSVNKVYGIVSIEHKINFILNLLAKDMEEVLNTINNFLEKGIDIKRLTYDLVHIIKDIIIHKNTNNPTTMFILTPFYFNQLAPYITIEECFNFIEIFMETSNHYHEANNSKIYFELACMKICNKIKDDNKTTLEEKSIPLNKNNQKETFDSKEEAIITEIKNIEQPLNHNTPNIHHYQDYEIEENTSNITLEEITNQINQEPNENNNSLIPQILEPQQPEKKSHDIEYNMDYILNILVQAERTLLNDIQNKWSIIQRYIANINTAKYATMLFDASPVAACSKAIIIAFEHKPAKNNINNIENYFKIRTFLKEILKEEYEIIALTNNEWQDIRNNYISLRQTNQLPTPYNIELSYQEIEKKETTKQLTKGQKMAYDLFGDIVEIEE